MRSKFKKALYILQIKQDILYRQFMHEWNVTELMRSFLSRFKDQMDFIAFVKCNLIEEDAIQSILDIQPFYIRSRPGLA